MTPLPVLTFRSAGWVGVEPEHDIDMAATVIATNPLSINQFSLTPLARGARGRAPSTSSCDSIVAFSASIGPGSPCTR